MTSQAGLSRTKMKPPWPRFDRPQEERPEWPHAGPEDARRKKPVIGVCPTVLLARALLFVALIIVCDNCRSSSGSRVPSGADESPTANGGLVTTTHEISQNAGTPFQSAAHFNLSKMPRVVAASSSQTEVYLPCQILNLDEDQAVSWIRKRDSLVLTVDKMRLVDDTRFELNQAPDDWTLVLSQPNELDAGLYECQVSSMEPKLSHLIELRMVHAHSSISNFSSLYVRPRDLINLTCSIEAPQATNYVYWYKNKEVAHFDNLRPATQANSAHTRANSTSPSAGPAPHPSSSASSRRRSRRRALASGRAGDGPEPATEPQLASRAPPPELSTGELSDRQRQPHPRRPTEPDVQWSRSSSTLIIREAQLNDTANYTCLPSNAKPSYIRVIVIENGLGSQPEKRSLQADSAPASIVSPHSTWLKVRSLALKLSHAVRDFVTLGYFKPNCYVEQVTRTRDDDGEDSTNSVIPMLIEVITDDNVARWTLSIVAALYVLAKT